MRDTLRRVGQHLIIGFDGLTASDDVRRLIRDFAVGHVILFARNVEKPAQVADLVRELQDVARRAGHDTPLMVSVDQEGGRVARMKDPWTTWPPLRALGRIDSEDLSYQMGKALARELLACGVTLDYAPIVDVDTNPKNPIIGDRAFGDDPKLVGRLAAAMIRGFQENGVAACAKHFPGHGDTDKDSHLELPVVDTSPRRMEEVELPPFKAAIAAGVATIMTAHILVREMDDGVPATLSPVVIDGLLRRKLGYQGVIISDDLEMKAVANLYPTAVLAVKAVQAGCDLVPVCSLHDEQVRAAEGLVRALEAGTIRDKAFEDSDRRVRLLKEAYLSDWPTPDPKQAEAAAGSGELLARRIADESGMSA
jgi:beta-N-acetylhexosaminidase